MENAIQARDKATGLGLAPPLTVLVDNWKGTGRRVRLNLADFDPARDGAIVAGSEARYFGAEVAAWEAARHRHRLAQDLAPKRSTGLTGGA